MTQTIPPTAVPSSFEALYETAERCAGFLVNCTDFLVPEFSMLPQSFFLGGVRLDNFHDELKVSMDYVAGVNMIYYVEDVMGAVWSLQPLTSYGVFAQ